jgi:hypothetical protein
MLNVALGRASAVPRELRVVPIEASMILDLRPLKDRMPLPICTARESFQGILRHLADIPVVIIRSFLWAQ